MYRKSWHGQRSMLWLHLSLQTILNRNASSRLQEEERLTPTDQAGTYWLKEVN